MRMQCVCAEMQMVLIRRTLKKSVLTQWKSHAVTVLQSVNVKTPIPIAMCDQVVDPKGEAIWKLKAYNGRVVASWLAWVAVDFAKKYPSEENLVLADCLPLPQKLKETNISLLKFVPLVTGLGPKLQSTSSHHCAQLKVCGQSDAVQA